MPRNERKRCDDCGSFVEHLYGIICPVCAEKSDAKIDKWLRELRESHPEVYEEEEHEKTA